MILFEKIRARVESWNDESSTLGDVILTMVPLFKLYPVYVSEFEQQMKTLRETKASNAAFAAFLQQGFKNMGDTSNDIASLLVVPVQRIPRYLMLVKQVREKETPCWSSSLTVTVSCSSQLLKHTWQTHADFARLHQCEEQIAAVAIIVDQKVKIDRFLRLRFGSNRGSLFLCTQAKDAENVQKMHNCDVILNNCDFALLDPQRRFVHSGIVHVEKHEKKNIALKAFSLVKPVKVKGFKNSFFGSIIHSFLSPSFVSRLKSIVCSCLAILCYLLSRMPTKKRLSIAKNMRLWSVRLRMARMKVDSQCRVRKANFAVEQEVDGCALFFFSSWP